MSNHTPFLIIVSAPSGCGKTTILRRALAGDSGIEFSVSDTSRPQRPGEIDGQDYHFISTATFRENIEQGVYLEYAEVHGNYYGTSRIRVEKSLEQGRDVVLDIDIQGKNLVEQCWAQELVTVFILPPSLGELRRRLVSRGTESSDDFQRRLGNARSEIEQARDYRYQLVNREVGPTVSSFLAIVTAERSRSVRNREVVTELLREFSEQLFG